jgi:hypothetical protein
MDVSWVNNKAIHSCFFVRTRVQVIGAQLGKELCELLLFVCIGCPNALLGREHLRTMLEGVLYARLQGERRRWFFSLTGPRAREQGNKKKTEINPHIARMFSGGTVMLHGFIASLNSLPMVSRQPASSIWRARVVCLTNYARKQVHCVSY